MSFRKAITPDIEEAHYLCGHDSSYIFHRNLRVFHYFRFHEAKIIIFAYLNMLQGLLLKNFSSS